MRVKEIVIDGFKSYAKRTVIASWDPQFNCITGLNGSGKSNILDAICFVLGITSMSTVRAQNQQDLIYKRGQAGITKASVSIVFDNTDKSRSPLDYQDASSITVTRQVVLGGTSKYLVNGHRAQQIQVQQLFQEVQLNVNNPNFLIMQGQITKVLNMRPTEILGLIEEAAGTGMYEKERVRAVKEIRDRDAPLHETEALLNEEVRPKLEVWRKQKRDFLSYQQCAASTEALERVVIGSQYILLKRQLDQKQAEEEHLNRQNEELKANIITLETKLKALDTTIDELKFEDSKNGDVNKLDIEIQGLNEEKARLLITLEDKQQQLNHNKAVYERSKNSLVSLEKHLQTHNQEVGAFEEEHAALQAKQKERHTAVVEKRELLSGLRTGISTTGDKETGYAYVTKRLREQVLATSDKISRLEVRKKVLESSMDSNHEVSRSASEQITLQKEHLLQLESKAGEIKDSLSKSTEFIQTANSLKQDMIANKDQTAKINRDIERLISQYPNLSVPEEMQIPKVKGRLIHVFKLLEEHLNKAKALEITAGNELWSMVVENTETAQTILKFARKKRLYVLPMNKLRTFVISKDRVSQIDPVGAWRAIDLIGFDEDVRPAVEYAFGSTVICATADIAKRAAFQFKFKAITLEGDVFEPRGVVSGGSDNSRLGGNVFSVVSQYHKLVGQKLELESITQNLQARLADYGNLPLQVEQMRGELSVRLHEAQIARERLNDLESKYDEATQNLQEHETITRTHLPKLHTELADLERQLEKSIQDATEFTNNREGKIKQLMQELDNAEQDERRISKELEVRDAQHVMNHSELVRIRTEMEQESESIVILEKSSAKISEEIAILQNRTIPDISRKISELKKIYDAEISKVSTIRNTLLKYEREINEGKSRLSDMKVEIKQVLHQHGGSKERLSAAKLSLHSLEKKYSQAEKIAAEVELAGELVEGNELNALSGKLAHELKIMKDLAGRVDMNVVSMVERLENDEVQLRQRIATIRNDKIKLAKSMDTLNERRRKTIDSVWSQVSEDFGMIFGDLLPGSCCELVPVNGKPIEEGFSIKVRLGATWKEGLTELSGGQRSLVALSLILALLRYHPAPMYILDEVDAALDVHHTRNIGHIIKTRFKNAQFIVVSLKDDMFTNANRIFQTRFIDGTSTVHIMA